MQEAVRRRRRKILGGLSAFILLLSIFGLFVTFHRAPAKVVAHLRPVTFAMMNAPLKTVVYEAEEGFLSGGTQVDTRTAGYSGRGYVDGFTRPGAQAIFTVNVPADRFYPVALRYANGSGISGSLSISANGIVQQQISLPPTGGNWATQITKLALRAGINTLTYRYEQGDRGNMSLDAISISRDNGLAPRGATVAYVEQEAENASYTGTLIGPNYTFTTLPAEASGREAVQLNARGQYVEFTLTQPANALDLRSSIPDSANGAGLTAPLNLYINGHRQAALSLTSRFGWFYGGYPFTNRPTDGIPHHFYDETRMLLGQTFPTGTKIRVQMDAVDNAPWYVIDLADFYQVPAPYTQPNGYLSVAAFGADPTGCADSTQAIQNAVNAAESSGKGVWVPAGNYRVTSHILLNNVTIRGAGPWYTTLGGKGVGLYGNYAPTPSSNVQIYDLAISGQVMNRDDSAQLNGIGGSLGAGSVVQNVWIQHTKAGMWFDGPFSDLLVVGDTMRDLTADGINFHDGITNAIVEQTTVRNTGDDGLAMWSGGGSDEHDIFKFNSVQNPILANNIAIYGGANNGMTDNIVADTLTEGGGLHVGNRFGAMPLAGTTTIARNTTIRAGQLDPNWQYGVGALWFYAQNGSMSGTINVTNDELDDSPYEAIMFTGESITNVNFEHVTIDSAGTFAFQIQSAGSATASYVTATNLGASGVYDCGYGLKITRGAGNNGWSTSHCGFPSTPTPT